MLKLEQHVRSCGKRKITLTLIRLGFLKVVISRGRGKAQFEPTFIFQEEIIEYQYNFIQLLSNIFRVG